MKHVLINGFAINANKIQRDVIEGREHIILKDVMPIRGNAVMNGLFYSEDFVTNHYKELEGTLAPLGHPKTASGELIPSTNVMAINQFHVGAFNKNVRLTSNCEVLMDVYIDSQFAANAKGGADLLSRIDSMESGEESSLWTSTGLYYQANTEAGEHGGKSYRGQITDGSFEHNALLLNEAPAGGNTGFTINSEEVETVSLAAEADQRREGLMNKVKFFFAGNDMSHDEIFQLIRGKLNEGQEDDYYFYPTAIFNSYFVYQDDGLLKKRTYVIDGGIINLGEPQVVQKETNYITVNEESEMDEAKLEAMFTKLLQPVNEQLAANAETINKQGETITALGAQLTANADKEISDKRAAVKKHFKLEDIAVNSLTGDALDSMYAQTATSAPVAGGLAANADEDADGFDKMEPAE